MLTTDPRSVARQARLRRVRALLDDNPELKAHEVAELVGASTSVILDDFVTLGWSKATRVAARLDRVRPLKESGMSVADIAVKLGITDKQAGHASALLSRQNGNPTSRGGKGKVGDRTAPADIHRIMLFLEPLGPALWEAINRLEDGDYDLVPDDLTLWDKVTNDIGNLGAGYRRLRKIIKEKRAR